MVHKFEKQSRHGQVTQGKPGDVREEIALKFNEFAAFHNQPDWRKTHCMEKMKVTGWR